MFCISWGFSEICCSRLCMPGLLNMPAAQRQEDSSEDSVDRTYRRSPSVQHAAAWLPLGGDSLITSLKETLLDYLLTFQRTSDAHVAGKSCELFNTTTAFISNTQRRG